MRPAPGARSQHGVHAIFRGTIVVKQAVYLPSRPSLSKFLDVLGIDTDRQCHLGAPRRLPETFVAHGGRTHLKSGRARRLSRGYVAETLNSSQGCQKGPEEANGPRRSVTRRDDVLFLSESDRE